MSTQGPQIHPQAGAAKPQKQYRVRYEDELNHEQLEVVMAGEGPMLVIAGAGSGKTRTLTYRVSRLIEDGVDPSEILLVTFTNKAAREMLSRVEQLVTIDTRRIWGGTFHSIGNRLLRRYAEAIGYRSQLHDPRRRGREGDDGVRRSPPSASRRWRSASRRATSSSTSTRS